MEQDLERVRQVLKEFSGADAIVWRYQAAHREFVLRLERPEQRKRCHLVCAQTLRASWRSVWSNARVSLEIVARDAARPSYLLADDGAGFMVECFDVEVDLDPSPSHW